MELSFMLQVLERLKYNIEIAVTGLKYDSSWVKPMHVSRGERDKCGQESIAIIDRLIKDIETDLYK